VEPPGGAGGIAGLPLRERAALGRSLLFLLFFAAKHQRNQIIIKIENVRTSTAPLIPVL
jgi:hypothetical protein